MGWGVGVLDKGLGQANKVFRGFRLLLWGTGRGA